MPPCLANISRGTEEAMLLGDAKRRTAATFDVRRYSSCAATTASGGWRRSGSSAVPQGLVDSACHVIGRHLTHETSVKNASDHMMRAIHQ